METVRIEPRDIGTDPERVKAREATGCRIAVFIGKPGKGPALVVNAETPEIEKQFAATIAGMALDALGQQWYGEARAEGVELGMRAILETVKDVCGKEVALKVIHAADAMAKEAR